MAIIRDTDKTIVHILLDESGVVIDLDTLSGIIAKVFQKGTEIDKFSLNAQTGFNTIEKTDPSNGILTFFLNAENLRKAKAPYEVFYKIKYEKVNTDFDNDVEERSTGAISLGKLQSSKLINNTFV